MLYFEKLAEKCSFFGYKEFARVLEKGDFFGEYYNIANKYYE